MFGVGKWQSKGYGSYEGDWENGLFEGKGLFEVPHFACVLCNSGSYRSSVGQAGP